MNSMMMRTTVGLLIVAVSACAVEAPRSTSERVDEYFTEAASVPQGELRTWSMDYPNFREIREEIHVQALASPDDAFALPPGTIARFSARGCSNLLNAMATACETRASTCSSLFDLWWDNC